MLQSRKLSFIEALANVAVGFGVSLASQLLIFSAYGVKLPLTDNVLITVWFTVISIARSYVLRRAFNRHTRRRAAPLPPPWTRELTPEERALARAWGVLK